MNKSEHTFHIPVMGLGFTIDTPVKVARYGISSVVSIIEDNLIEQMRKFYCEKEKEPYHPIETKEHDYRARRIAAYLNLLNRIVNRQTEQLKQQAFMPGSDIVKYFEMLPESSSSKKLYLEMDAEPDKNYRNYLQEELRKLILPGAIDVNIMTKCDRLNYSESGEVLPVEFADAMSALRGFAESDLSSSVIFSAGMNPRLYSYCESFNDFSPDENGKFKKKIILKVSDFRSAFIQGKFFAKKGMWVSEFRIESGLNCGGHAFPTEGHLLGPILEEFKSGKEELKTQLFDLYKSALLSKNKNGDFKVPEICISVQGGIGTGNENKFLLDYYNVDATGWGSPFLLVPEATNVDDETLKQLCSAKPADYYLSHASPLGVPFNNFRKSSSAKQRMSRIEKGRPGSPCYKKFLAFNTEFTEKPICTASREYQHLKADQLSEKHLSVEKQRAEMEIVAQKECLCEGLGSSALLVNDIPVPHKLTAVAICPGPNLAYFSNTFSLKQMVDHIYGRMNILNKEQRPSMFVKELRMYADYLKTEIGKSVENVNNKQIKYFEEFRGNLVKGIDYYVNLLAKLKEETENYRNNMYDELCEIKFDLNHTVLPEV